MTADSTFTSSNENNIKVKAYLERIGISHEVKPDYKTLRELHYAHVHNVPYENLDILRGKYLSIDHEAVFHKIVEKRRGGYCFELNGLFAWLLRAIGYAVTEFYGRYLEGEPLEMPMRRHRIIKVDLDGKEYICDVGVGVTAPRWPLDFVLDEIQKQGDEQYRIVTHPQLGYVVEFFRKGEWLRLYCFTTDPQFQIDFEMPNHWCLTHPDSIFKNMTMVFIRTEAGRNTIADVLDSDGNKIQEFRRFINGKVETVRPENPEEYAAALKSHFGIVLD
jgi:N-hydroxyarylamine O-acetyltransferase